ncbi:MAG: GMC family oxidoreductase [Acidobacteria bacterium]|nr:MAG: GMC family oxidoreductase [Acidobacteriota bacterium]
MLLQVGTPASARAGAEQLDSELQSRIWDAVVIGSGITGGWAAKELCEAGLDVLVLEAGRQIVPERDYGEHVPDWELPFHGLEDRERMAREQPIQSLTGACDAITSKFFVNDLENPYTLGEGSDGPLPFRWIRGRQVGGRSILWGRQSYRWSDLDFEANARDGHGVDWPIRYADLAPWYDHVERFAGIAGDAEGMAQLPDGQFLPAIPMNAMENAVRQRLDRAFGGARRLMPARVAVLTRHHNGRRACHYCGPCRRGCITRSYFSSNNATLPAAEATGRLTLRPHSVVRALEADDSGRRVGAVQVIDGVSEKPLRFRGRVVFLCASALESARILLNSRSERHPEGLANSSGQVGRNLMDHTFQVGARGDFPGELNDRYMSGRRPNSCYLPRFVNVDAASTNPDFLRGYGFQCGAGRSENWSGGWNRPGFGADFKRSLRGRSDWGMGFTGFGECLPDERNRVEIDPQVVDRWGIPVLRITATFRDNEDRMRRDIQVKAAEMLEAAGAKNVRTYDRDSVPGFAIHEMGTARMGRDPKTSVLNAWNQSWDLPNLFVTDGAAMTSSACQNPSLTYMALTARACDHAVGLLRRGEL